MHLPVHLQVTSRKGELVECTQQQMARDAPCTAELTQRAARVRASSSLVGPHRAAAAVGGGLGIGRVPHAPAGGTWLEVLKPVASKAVRTYEPRAAHPRMAAQHCQSMLWTTRCSSTGTP